jgi:hypothetical protein
LGDGPDEVYGVEGLLLQQRGRLEVLLFESNRMDEAEEQATRIEEDDDDQPRQSLEGMLSLTAARTRSTAKSPEAIESCILRAIDSLCVYASRLACCNDPNTIDT